MRRITMQVYVTSDEGYAREDVDVTEYVDVAALAFLVGQASLPRKKMKVFVTSDDDTREDVDVTEYVESIALIFLLGQGALVRERERKGQIHKMRAQITEAYRIINKLNDDEREKLNSLVSAMQGIIQGNLYRKKD